MNNEYKLLSKCLGYLVHIIISPTEVYFARLLTLVGTDDNKLILYLTNKLGVCIISKNDNEYNQYAITIKGQKVNKGLYISEFDIDHQNSTILLNSM